MSKTIVIEVWSRHLDDPAITLWACGEGEGALDPENLLVKALRRYPVFPAGLIEHMRLKSIVVELALFDRAFTVEEVRQEEPADEVLAVVYLLRPTVVRVRGSYGAQPDGENNRLARIATTPLARHADHGGRHAAVAA